MSLPPSADLEAFWSEVLSGVPERVRAAVESLAAEERASVVDHLEEIAAGEGWNEGQRRRARVALEALGALGASRLKP